MATVGKKLVMLLLQRERKENEARVKAGIKQKRVSFYETHSKVIQN
jgi:hypothetical protein